MIKSSEERFDGFFEKKKSSNLILSNLPLEPLHCVERTELNNLFNKVVKNNSVIKVQGIGGSGKTTFVNTYCRSKISNHLNYFWYTCSQSESEIDILNNLHSLNFPITRKSKQIQIKTLINYLNENSGILILDDFDKVDNISFVELFRSINHFGDSAKIICISSIDNNEMGGKYNYVKFRMPDGYSESEVKKMLSLKYDDISSINLDLLYKSTNFLPRFIEYLLSSESIEDFNLKVTDKSLGKRVQGWIKYIESNIQTNHIEILTFLSHIDGTFPNNILNFIEKTYRVDRNDLENSLYKSLILSEFEDGRLKLNTMLSKHYRSITQKKIANDIYTKIGIYFRSRIRHESDRVKKLLLSIKSIKYFHLAENYPDAKFVIDKNLKNYKLEGMYEEIIPILEIQIKNSDNNDVNWLKYHLSHANFLIGNYEKSLTQLRSQLYTFPNFTIKEKSKIQDIIRYELKVFLLYTELLSTIGQSEIAIEIILRKINKIISQEYSVSELSWQVISQFISNLSWYLIGNKEYDKAINVLNKLNQSTLLLQKDYSLAINNTRLAVAYYHKQEFDESKKLLERAYEVFASDKINDKRAIAWVSSNFVLLYLLNDNLQFEKPFNEYLKTCLEINSDLKLIDLNYYKMLKMLSDSPEKIPLDSESYMIEYVEDELKRQNDLLVKSVSITEKKEFVEITKSILGELKDTNYDMYSLINRFLNKKTVRIGGAYFKSFLNNVKHNASRILEYIFSTKNENEIFLTPYLNQMITEAVKFDEDGIDKYIIPNIELIINHTTDSIRLHYVRALSIGNRKQFAIRILKEIEDKSAEYYNLYGNAVSDSNKYESYKCYNIALEKSDSTYDKGRYLNNIAWLIYNNKWKDKYDEAIDYCKQSLEYRKYHFKFWPYSMHCLLLLNISLIQMEDLKEEFKKLIDVNNLNIKIKKSIIDKVHDKRKKKIIAVLD